MEKKKKKEDPCKTRYGFLFLFLFFPPRLAGIGGPRQVEGVGASGFLALFPHSQISFWLWWLEGNVRIDRESSEIDLNYFIDDPRL